MVGFGVFMIVGALLLVLGWEWGVPARVWIQLAFSILLVAAGISVFRRKAYRWALSAAIGMIVFGTINAGSLLQDPVLRRADIATQLAMAAVPWAIWGVPGILAVVFLVKRKAEFRPSQDV